MIQEWFVLLIPEHDAAIRTHKNKIKDRSAPAVATDTSATGED